MFRFHPATQAWLERRFGGPTRPQAEAWPAIQAGENVLVAAPTGSGKTLAAFLCAIDDLVRRGLAGELSDETHVVYISPLKALGNDIRKNLEEPLAGIREELRAQGLPDVPLRVEVRTGDTPAKDRARMTKSPPHIFVTTPESLFILLTSDGGRRMLKTARTVIVDEIHALVSDKRGSHLALSIERLEALAERKLARIGLSATQKPIEEVARFLVGTHQVAGDGTPRCRIVNAGHARALDIAVEVPGSPLETVMSHEVWQEVHERLVTLIEQHRTTLVFCNTRRLAERVTRSLSERIGEERVTSHHGSLSKEHRLSAEQRLKSGQLSALVATASLELGIDIGDVDLVCQLGSTRSIATFLQRVGRSGHHLRGTPKGRLFPLSRDELVECVALVSSIRRGELDRLCIPSAPLDILAQHVVSATAAEEHREDELFELVRRAWCYRDLSRAQFDEVVRMLAEGFSTRRGRRGAHLHHDAVNGRVRGRRGARLAAITSGGAIPDIADYEVVLEPEAIRVGSLNEDFAIESMAGDVFQLGNVSYRILRVEPGKVRVEDARGVPPTIPFWLGEAPGRTAELSESVSRLRAEVERALAESEPDAIARTLADELGLSDAATRQVTDHLAAARTALSVIPTQERLLLERFFDEAGNMHLVLHAPFGSRLNRAWGLALRKRFCRAFNFELQAAATEDAIVLSLGPTHSFPLEDVWSFLKSTTVREVLVQALLDAPMWQTRWRWNTTRSLAVLRFRGGRKVPPPLQRMQADDLLTVVFPDQVACLENVVGDREIPDHPLVRQTVTDCLTEAMDIDALEALLARIERGEIELVARDVTEPSPLAAEALNARPYAFLDDAPLEERRTQAVMSRRWLDAEHASDLGALDPAAIDAVCGEAWPDPRDADELHDALVLHGYLTAEEGARSELWLLFDELRAASRATVLSANGVSLWVAAERLPELSSIHPGASLTPAITAPARYAERVVSDEGAMVEIVRGRLEAVGPTTARAIASTLGVAPGAIEAALYALEQEGFVLRGKFRASTGRAATAAGDETEWCERRLLARIHRRTLNRLRAEIEPVTSADFVRFLTRWQRVDADTRVEGPEGLLALLELLEGYEAPAAAWETSILPARMREYDPAWLDALCLSGRAAWGRRTPAAAGRRGGPVRATPITLAPRASFATWLDAGHGEESLDALSPDARLLLGHLETRGASFFEDVVRTTGILRSRAEEALGELVSQGLVTSDGFSGLRALVTPPRRRRRARLGMEGAGRWSTHGESDPTRAPDPAAREREAADVEHIARALLRRWGVVFRRVAEREGSLPPWRDLLRVWRKLEARGEIRGGRFVAGFAGEQYALPEAVGALRDARRRRGETRLVSVSAADPLNLLGIVLPGPRLPSLSKNRVLLCDGLPVAVRDAGEIRFLEKVDVTARPTLERALLAPKPAIAARAYAG